MILCIDTVTAGLGVTLISSDSALFRPLVRERVGENLVAEVGALLKEVGAPLAALTGIAVLTGPGSFTGLRVGITVANVLAHELGIPVLGLRLDEWWAYRLPKKSRGRFLYSMNRDEVYAAPKPGIYRFLDVLSGLKVFWGELSEVHRALLPAGALEASDLLSPAEGWAVFVRSAKWGKAKKPVEPFYAKAPNITVPSLIASILK